MTFSVSKPFAWIFLASAMLCTLCFGFVLLFCIVVMPGIGRLDDGDFLQAFRVIDGVIQDQQPVFYFIWIGSVATLITAVVWDTVNDEVDNHWALWISLGAYLLCQVTTFSLNVPLNDHLQALDLTYLDSSTKLSERKNFEGKWNFWNWFRTVIMGCVSLYLLIVLMEMKLK